MSTKHALSVTAVLHDDELTRVQGKVADAMLAARAKEQA